MAGSPSLVFIFGVRHSISARVLMVPSVSKKLGKTQMVNSGKGNGTREMFYLDLTQRSCDQAVELDSWLQSQRISFHCCVIIVDNSPFNWQSIRSTGTTFQNG